MLITLTGLVLVVVAAVFVAWPLLVPSAAEAEAEADPAGSPAAVDLAKEKDAALVAIRDADFDHSVGKLSDEDHAALRSELEQRALRAIAALDAAAAASAGGAAREAGPEAGLRAVRGHGGATGAAGAETAGGGFCPGCGRRFGSEASFCASCGKELPTGGRRPGRRRATS